MKEPAEREGVVTPHDAKNLLKQWYDQRTVIDASHVHATLQGRITSLTDAAFTLAAGEPAVGFLHINLVGAHYDYSETYDPECPIERAYHTTLNVTLADHHTVGLGVDSPVRLFRS